MSTAVALSGTSSRLGRWYRDWRWLCQLVPVAVLIGWSVAGENWLILLCAAVLPFAMAWPVSLSLGVFALVVPFDVVSVIGKARGAGTTVTFYVGAVAGVVLIATAILRHRLVRPLPASLWFFLFIAYGGASTLWAIDPTLSLGRLQTSVGLLLMFLVAASVRITRKELSWTAICAIAGGCAAAAYACFQFYHGVVYRGAELGRGSLIVGQREVDPNMFAASLFLPISLAIGKFLESKRLLPRMLSLSAVALLGFTILITMSRGALVGMAILLFVYARRMGLNLRVIIAGALVAGALIVVPRAFFNRIETTEATAGSGRLYIWEAGLAAMKDYGLFGAGLENFSPAYTEHVGEASHIRAYSSDAHNIYLSIGVELGIIGLGFMLLGMRSALRSSREVRQKGGNGPAAKLLVPYEAATWAMLVSSFFVGMMWQKCFWLIWIMLALAVRVSQAEVEAEAASVEENTSERFELDILQPSPAQPVTIDGGW